MSATTTMTALARALRAAATMGALLVALAACGTAPAAEDVPGLADQLAEVDAAIADEDYAAARKAVDALASTAARARVSGDLTREQADRVLEAATAVLEALPEEAAEDDADDESDGLPVPSPTAVLQDDDEDDDSGGDDESGKGEDKSKSEKGKSNKDESKKDKSRDN